MTFSFTTLTPMAHILLMQHLLRDSALNKVAATAVAYFPQSNRGKQATPRVIRSLTHIKNSRLFSHVMLCGADVSLGKCPACEACVRLCLAACSENICMEREPQTRWPESESVGKYMFVFRERPSVEVSDPPKSQLWNGQINQPLRMIQHESLWNVQHFSAFVYPAGSQITVTSTDSSF